MFHHHLVALQKKLSSHVTLLRWLVGSGWGAGVKTLCIATLSLVYSTAEYCAPSLVSQCSHSPHRQCLEWCLAHSHWMPASHFNGPPTCTLRHPASWALLTGSDTLLGLPWISGPWSYLVWSLKWVLRYSASGTKIQTPVCASCAESFGQPCQIWHLRLWMDKSQMENGVLWRCFQAPCFCAWDQCQACWDGLTPSSLG